MANRNLSAKMLTRGATERRNVELEQIIPRSEGRGALSSKLYKGRSVIDDFRCSGALRVLFPRTDQDLSAILINTSGGLTSGDIFEFEATAQKGSNLTLSTQAAERGYRALTGSAVTRTTLSVEDGARLNWLPQELILFDGCDIERSLTANMQGDAQFLFVEPVVFGRTAMKETVNRGRFLDQVTIYRDQILLYFDRVRLEDDLKNTLSQRVIAQGCLAMANLIYIGPDAEAHLDTVRSHLPITGGATMIEDDVMVGRVLASDGFELRQALLPILDLLSQNTLPKTWRL